MGLVVSEVRVGLNLGSYVLELGAFLQLYVHHAAVNALAQWDGDRESLLDTLLAAYANRVAHAHTRTEVGIGKTLRSKAFHEHAHY